MMREAIVQLAFLAAIIWSAWVLGGGYLTIDALERDVSGETAWQYTSSLIGDQGESAHVAFTQQWSDPVYRRSWLTGFESTFWPERIKLWVFPLVGIAVLAFLARLLPDTKKPPRAA